MDAMPSLEMAVVALAAALASWTGLLVCRAVLPSRTLRAHMREQPPGTGAVSQIGGLVVIPIYLIGIAVAASRMPEFRPMLSVLGGSAALLWIVGIIDDHRHVAVSLRLAAQVGVALAVAFSLDPAASLSAGMLPWWIERVLVGLGLVYFINMTNFMDGMDLMTVVGLGMPLLLCLALLLTNPLGDPVGYPTLVLAAALVGFGAVNLPPARLYLGDNGSLPLGLAGGVLAAHLASGAGPVAALLPFGYYFADSATTLAMRLIGGENILEAHSKHAYQVARKAGRPVLWVVAHLVVLNLALAIAARMAVGASWMAQTGLAAVGAALCVAVIVHFRRQRAA